jgi:tRNA A37 threonylcarbamoyltransferase TsaD
MITLGIETSCDETSVAVLENESRIIVNLVATQIEAHQIFGGVVPEIASRKHLEMLNPLLETARLDAGLEWRDIDLIAVTAGFGGIAARRRVGGQSAQFRASHSLPAGQSFGRAYCIGFSGAAGFEISHVVPCRQRRPQRIGVDAWF